MYTSCKLVNALNNKIITDENGRVYLKAVDVYKYLNSKKNREIIASTSMYDVDNNDTAIQMSNALLDFHMYLKNTFFKKGAMIDQWLDDSYITSKNDLLIDLDDTGLFNPEFVGGTVGASDFNVTLRVGTVFHDYACDVFDVINANY